jgi:hypothetical protein
MWGKPIVLIVFGVLLLIRLNLAWFGCAVLLAMLVPMPNVPVFVSAPAG